MKLGKVETILFSLFAANTWISSWLYGAGHQWAAWPGCVIDAVLLAVMLCAPLFYD